ncbi:hypothetical protein BDL97_15G084800 [Sphagnum fallax]|nr:hypothetical protein BDL97_15G084800 [Sphagnum fallax]
MDVAGVVAKVTSPLAAVVGAGVAGLVCASMLAERGIAVKVFEMGRGPGGRMSQRRERTEDGRELLFDHGAQYFTVRKPEVQKLVERWQMSGLVAEWRGRFGTLDVQTGNFVEDTVEKRRYVGVPAMNSICKALSLSEGVQANYGVTVTGLEWRKDGLWNVKAKDGESLGVFDAVIIADKGLASARFLAQTGLPPPLEGAGVPELTKRVAAVTTAPCFALMLAFAKPLTLVPFDGAVIDGSKIISWVARDSSKPGRATNSSECWVVHSTAEYASNIISQTGLNKPSNELLSAVALDLLAAFEAAVPNIPSPSFLKAHRWGGAFPTTAIASEEKCILEEERRIAVCGDFCVGPRVEDAVLSGVSAAEKVASLF